MYEPVRRLTSLCARAKLAPADITEVDQASEVTSIAPPVTLALMGIRRGPNGVGPARLWRRCAQPWSVRRSLYAILIVQAATLYHIEHRE